MIIEKTTESIFFTLEDDDNIETFLNGDEMFWNDLVVDIDGGGNTILIDNNRNLEGVLVDNFWVDRIKELEESGKIEVPMGEPYQD